jgi:DNA-binding NtrC family response regulator
LDVFKRLRNKRILLVDDDEWIRDSMNMFFGEEGCKLVGLPNAEEAMQALIREPFDIIISDYKLPGMDGLEFFRLASRTRPEVIMILITAYGSEELFRGANKLGVHDLILKPLTVEAIEKSLGVLLEKIELREDRDAGGKN